MVKTPGSWRFSSRNSHLSNLLHTVKCDTYLALRKIQDTKVMRDHSLIPWSEVSSWACKACGKCCLGYRVPLKPDEYARVAKMYGFNVVDYGLGKIYLKHGQGNRCIFQRPSQGRWICSLQGIKPMACRLFPFRLHSKPVYSRGDRSEYHFGGRKYHIYLDPDCSGVNPGKPSARFVNSIIPEILRSGMGARFKQKYTTSKYISWTPP